MSDIKVTGMGFADQLPSPDPIPAGKLFPRAAEVKKYKEFFNLVISLFVFWFIGYAGTMIFKWVVYAVTLNHEMFNDMLHHIFFRTGTDVGSRKYGVYVNLKEAFGNTWWNITEIAFITYIVIKCVKDRTSVQINGTKVCLLLIIGGIILCRYLVFSNHVNIHFWVTYRLLMAPILTFNLIIAGIGEQYETGNS